MAVIPARKRNPFAAVAGWSIILAVPSFFSYFRYSNGSFTAFDILAFTAAAAFLVFCLSYSSVPGFFYKYIGTPNGIEVKSRLALYLMVSPLATVPMFLAISLSSLGESQRTFLVFLVLSAAVVVVMLLVIVRTVTGPGKGASSVVVSDGGICLTYANEKIRWADVTEYRKKRGGGYRVNYTTGSGYVFLNHVTCGKLDIGRILYENVPEKCGL